MKEFIDSNGTMLKKKFPVTLAVIVVSLFPLARFLYDCSKGLGYLIYQYLCDDTFYYYVVSKHIPEFNIGIPTSGFHPLYAFMISPFQTSLAPALAIPMSLLILILAYCAFIFLLYHLLSPDWPRPIPFMCVLACAFSGKLYGVTMTGLEAILAALLVLMFFVILMKIQRRSWKEAGAVNLLALGLIAGLSFWARMDSPLVLVPASVYILLKLLKNKPGLIPCYIAPTMILPLLWMAYMKIYTGSPFPTSGAALRVLTGTKTGIFAPIKRTMLCTETIAQNLSEFFVHGAVWAKITGLIIFLVIMVLSVIITSRRNKPQRNDPRILLAALVLGGLACLCAYYMFIQGRFRSWYSAHFAIAVYGVFLPFIMLAIFRLLPSRNSAIVTILLLIGAISVLSKQGPYNPNEYDKYKSALAANRIMDNIDKNEKIGAFNTGVYNYFMNRDVINLDGVINPETMKAIKNNTLPDYVKEKNIKYLIEHDIGKAGNFQNIYDDERFELIKWIDLSEFYPGYNNKYTKKVFLWKLRVKNNPEGAL